VAFAVTREGRGGALPAAAAYSRLVRAGVDDVRAQALRLFRTRQGAEAFLHAPCAALDGVPIELAEGGRAAAVLFYLERLERFASPGARGEWVPGYRPGS
jgi:hypothetical protein